MNSRSRFTDQSGATLLIIIGIAAALAVMTASLVFVIVNMQANTADSRVRDKAAAVGEAAVDAQMYALGRNWPMPGYPGPAPTMDAALVRTQFDTSEFPNSTSDFVSSDYYDNFDNNGDHVINHLDGQVDANGDGLMYVEGQGKVGTRATRFQVLVERTFVPTDFPHGIAVYDGGGIDSNAPGTNPKVQIYISGGYPVSSYVNGVLPDPKLFAEDIAVASPVVPPLKDLFPDSKIQQIIDLAKSMGRYYDVAGGHAQMPTDASGICVIRVANPSEVNLGAFNGGQINMASQGHDAPPAATDEPGILLILGPEPGPGLPISTVTGPNISINMANNDRFYGIFYTDGQLNPAHGTPAFYGMTIFRSYMNMIGTPRIFYDDSAITKLFNKYTLSVKLVPNTWREIHPK